MKRHILSTLFFAVLLSCPTAADAHVRQAPNRDSARCHFVKKKVHGKLRRVRVCAKPVPKPPAKLVAKAVLDGQITEIADGFGSLWVRVATATGGAFVERIDPSNLSVVAKIQVGGDTEPTGSPVGLAVGNGAVWVPNHDAETLSRIDPATNSIVATIPLPDAGAHSVTTSAGAVWVGTEGQGGVHPGVIARVDPATNKVVATIGSPRESGVQDLAFGAGSLWADLDQGAARFDPESGSLIAFFVLPDSPVSCGGVAADDAAAWVASAVPCFHRGGTSGPLVKISASTNSVSKVAVGHPYDVALDLGSVWTADIGGLLRRFNPSTRALLGTLNTHASGWTVVAVANGAVWIGDARGTLQELAPTGNHADRRTAAAQEGRRPIARGARGETGEALNPGKSPGPR